MQNASDRNILQTLRNRYSLRNPYGEDFMKIRPHKHKVGLVLLSYVEITESSMAIAREKHGQYGAGCFTGPNEAYTTELMIVRLELPANQGGLATNAASRPQSILSACCQIGPAASVGKAVRTRCEATPNAATLALLALWSQGD